MSVLWSLSSAALRTQGEPHPSPNRVRTHGKSLTRECSGKLWETMLKKGPSSSALSSATAQGFLPHYAGHAAASLGPSLNTNQGSLARDVASGKLADAQDLSESGAVLFSAVPEQFGENRPPQGVNSLEDQFKNLSVETAGRRNLASAFGM